MKKNLLVLSIILISTNLSAQQFQIGHTTITLIDSSRSNRNIPTEIYYPSDISGNNVPVTMLNNSKFPVLGFGHGFVMAWDAYQNIWEAVVPEGFIIAFPKTEGGIAPSHSEFGKDIAFVISELNVLGLDNASLFFNRVDTMNCVMGHSMGGGAAFLAAQFSASVKAIATLAAAETNPSAIQAASGLGIPALIFAGGNDCVTPAPANQILMYDTLQSNCKTFISITGGSHCQMAESNFLCNFGEITCTPPPAITRSEQHLIINRYLLPWLKYELKNDCISGATFDTLLTADTSIVYLKTCLLCSTTGINENNESLNFELFPNPFTDKIIVQYNKSATGIFTIDLYSIDGTLVFSKIVENLDSKEQIEISIEKNLAPGVYILKSGIGQQQTVSKIIRL